MTVLRRPAPTQLFSASSLALRLVIGASFEEERRGKAVGTWAGFTGTTMVLGSILGTYLSENLS